MHFATRVACKGFVGQLLLTNPRNEYWWYPKIALPQLCCDTYPQSKELCPLLGQLGQHTQTPI